MKRDAAIGLIGAGVLKEWKREEATLSTGTECLDPTQGVLVFPVEQ
jgi:hypothetical protein